MAITIGNDNLVSGQATPFEKLALSSVGEDVFGGFDPMESLDELSRKREEDRRRQYAKYRRDSRKKVDDAILDFDNFNKGESDEVKRRAIIRGVLQSELDSNPTSTWGYAASRKQAANRLFNGEGGDSDEEFFGKLQERATRKKESDDFYEALSLATTNSFLTGVQTDYEFLQGYKDNEVMKREGVLALNHIDLIREKLQEQYGDVLPQVQTTLRRMQAGAEWVSQAAALAKLLDDEQKDKYLQLLRQGALDNPSPEMEGAIRKITNNFVKGSSRGIGGAFSNLATGAGDIITRMGSSFRGPGGYIGSQDAYKEAANERELNQAWQKAYREEADFIADVRKVFESDFDPIRPLAKEGSTLRAIEEGIYGAPGAISTTIQAAIPGIGLPMVFATIMEGERQGYRDQLMAAGLDREAAGERAGAMSVISTAPQMVLEKVQAGAVFGKIPGLEKVFNVIDGRVKNRLARGATKFVVGGIGETGIELGQDVVSDLVADFAYAFDQVGPDVEWLNGKDGHFDGYFNKSVTTFVAVAPLAIIGAAGGLSAEKRAAAFRAAPPLVKKAYGMRDEDIEALDNAETPAERVKAFNQAVANSDPNSQEAKDANEQIELEQERQRQIYEDMARVGMAPGVRTSSDQKFEVYDTESGEVLLTVDTATEAAEAVYKSIGTREKVSDAEFDSLVTLLESAKIANVDSIGEFENILMTTEEAGRVFEGADERLAKESELHEKKDGGSGAVSEVVFGASIPEGVGGRKQTTMKLWKGSSVFTVVHEKAHQVRRELIARGELTEQEQIDFFRSFNKQLKGKKTRDGRELEFKGFDEETVSEEAMDEAWAKFAEIALLKTENGKKSEMRVLLDKNLKAMAQRFVPSANKFAAFIRAMKKFFGVNLQRAAVLKRAVSQGKMDAAEVEKFTAAVLGQTLQDDYDSQVNQAFDENIAPEAATAPDNMPFSFGEYPQEEIDKVLPGAKYIHPDELSEGKIEGPVVVGVYHGSTHDIDRFRPGFTQGDWGDGIYGSSNPDDVSKNYALVGPDLTARVEQETDRRMGMRDADEEDVRREVEAELVGSGGRIYPLLVPMKNPAVVGGEFQDQTYFDPNEFDESLIKDELEYAEEIYREENGIGVDEELDDWQRDEIRQNAIQEAYDTKTLVNPLLNAIQEVGRKYDISESEFINALDELIYEGGYLSIIEEAIRGFGIYVEDYDGNVISPGQLAREVFEEMGYDGIIDRQVNDKFGDTRGGGVGMPGLTPDTVHVIVSADASNRIKSAINPDVAFSLGDVDAKYLEAVKAEDMEAAQQMVDQAARNAGYDTTPVYHGTSQDFEAFSKEERGSSTRAVSAKAAFFFTDGKVTAQSYAEESARQSPGSIDAKVEELLRKANEASAARNWELSERLMAEAEELEFSDGDRGLPPTKVLKVYLKGKFLTIDAIGNDFINLDNAPDMDEFGGSLTAAIEAAKERGFDGLKIENFNDMILGDEIATHYAVFEPSQIKLADPITYDQDGNIVPLSERFDPMDERLSFSLGDEAIAQALGSDVMSRVKNPEVKAGIMGNLARVLNKVKVDARRIANAVSDPQIITDPTKVASLRKQAALMRQQREDELVNEILNNEGRALAVGDALTLKDMPIHGYIANPGKGMRGGMIESKSAFIKRTGQEPGGEYDGSETALKSLVFGGTRSPDQVARELYGQGLLSEDSVGELWNVLEQERQTVTKAKEDFKNAKKLIRDAKATAKQEAQDWLDKQMDFQSQNFDVMTRMRDALAMLDSIIKVLPIDLRGRIGGFVQISKLMTEEARLKFLLTRIDKMEKVLDRWISKEFDKQFKKLRDKSKKIEKPGKVVKAKQTIQTRAAAALYDIFDTINSDKVYEMTEAQVSSKVAEIQNLIDTGINDGTLTADEEAHLEKKIQMINGFGDWKNRTLEEKEAALKNGWNTLEEGMQRALIEKTQIKERRARSRETLINDAGGKPSPGEVDIKEKQQGVKATLESAALGFMDFGQFLGHIFGVDSKEAQKFEDWERQASFQNTDRMFDHQSAIENFWTALADGDVVAGLKLQHDIQTKTYKIKVPGQNGRKDSFRVLTIGQMIQARMMWRQPDGRRHMEGREATFDKKGNELTKATDWSYSQEFMDNIDAVMTSEGLALEAFLTDQYSKEYDVLNEVHKRIYGASLPYNPMYSPLTMSPLNKNTKEMVDPLTGQAVSEMSSQPGALLKRSASAVAEPNFLDSLHTFISHKTQIEYWMAYAELNKEMAAVMNNRDIQNVIKAKAGLTGVNTMSDWQNLFAIGGVKNAAMSLELMRGTQRVLGRLTQAALVGKVSVLVIQSTQLGASLAHMSTGAYLKRLAKLLTGQLSWRDAISSEYIQRRMKDAPPAVRMAMEQLRSAKPSKAKWLSHKLGNLISATDAFFTSASYAIIYDYQKTREGLSDKEAHRATEKLVEGIAQPMRSGKRSLVENLNKNPWQTLAWAFASEPRQKLMLAAYTGFKGRTKEEKARAIAVTWGVGGAAATIIRAMMADIKDDEDEDFFDEKYWNVPRMVAQSLAGPFAGAPFLGDVVEDIGYFALKQLGYKTGYSPDGSLLTAIPRGGKAAFNLAEKAITDEEYESMDKIIRDVDTMVNGAAAFNESAAAYSTFIHAVRDLFRISKNVVGD